MTKRRVPATAENTTTKATGLTVRQARAILENEDSPVRLAVSVGGLLAFHGEAA